MLDPPCSLTPNIHASISVDWLFSFAKDSQPTAEWCEIYGTHVVGECLLSFRDLEASLSSIRISMPLAYFPLSADFWLSYFWLLPILSPQDSSAETLSKGWISCNRFDVVGFLLANMMDVMGALHWDVAIVPFLPQTFLKICTTLCYSLHNLIFFTTLLIIFESMKCTKQGSFVLISITINIRCLHCIKNWPFLNTYFYSERLRINTSYIAYK